MAFEGRAMKLSAVTYARVTAIKKRMEQAEQRAVAYDRVIEQLIERFESTGGVIVQVTESREAGR